MHLKMSEMMTIFFPSLNVLMYGDISLYILYATGMLARTAVCSHYNTVQYNTVSLKTQK